MKKNSPSKTAAIEAAAIPLPPTPSPSLSSHDNDDEIINNFLEGIPNDPWQIILSFLNLRDLLQLTLVSKQVQQNALRAHNLIFLSDSNTTTSNESTAKTSSGGGGVPIDRVATLLSFRTSFSNSSNIDPISSRSFALLDDIDENGSSIYREERKKKKYLSFLLGRFQSPRQIILDDCSIYKEFIIDILNSCDSLSSLQHLELYHLNIGTSTSFKGTNARIRGARPITTCSPLKLASSNLDNNSSTSDNDDENNLHDSDEDHPQQSYFNNNNNNNSTLKHLHISGSIYCDYHTVLTSFTTSPNLQYLGLDGCHHLTDANVQDLTSRLNFNIHTRPQEEVPSISSDDNSNNIENNNNNSGAGGIPSNKSKRRNTFRFTRRKGKPNYKASSSSTSSVEATTPILAAAVATTTTTPTNHNNNNNTSNNSISDMNDNNITTNNVKQSNKKLQTLVINHADKLYKPLLKLTSAMALTKIDLSKNVRLRTLFQNPSLSLLNQSTSSTTINTATTTNDAGPRITNTNNSHNNNLYDFGPPPNLRELDLSFCTSFTDEGVQNIMSTCFNLERLNLRGCKGLKDLVIVPSLPPPSPSSPSSSSVEDISSIAASASTIYSTDKLQELDLGMCVGLKTLSLNCPSLKSLEIAFCLGLRELKLHSHTIQELDLSMLSIKNLELNTPCLESLNISGCSNLHETTFLQWQCPNLKMLYACGTNIDTDLLRKSLGSCSDKVKISEEDTYIALVQP